MLTAGDDETRLLDKKLVVVAPAEFHACLADFLAHKAQQLPTELVALEDVLQDRTGVDDPEKLKRFLFQRWRDDRLGYALLVGDVDLMPVRYMVLDRVTPAAFDYAFYPSDLYYADLAKADGSFDDWNASRAGFREQYFGEVRGEKNKDGPINEDQVDYLPDIAVGRWPVSTAEQAAIAARKTIRYEQGLLAAPESSLESQTSGELGTALLTLWIKIEFLGQAQDGKMSAADLSRKLRLANARG